MIEIYLTIVGVLFIIYLSFGLRLFKDTQRGVVFTFGKKTRTIGPGISIIFPGIEELKYVDVKQKSLDVGELKISLLDGEVDVRAAIFIKISSPEKSLEIDNLEIMLIQSARSALKVILGQKNSSHVIKNGSEVLSETKDYLNKEANDLGVEILGVKVYDFKVKQNKTNSTKKMRANENKPKKSKQSKSTEKKEIVDVDDDFLLN